MADQGYSMDQKGERAVELLRELGGRPAIPFFEDGPSRSIMQTLEQAGVPAQRDSFGNVVAHYSHEPDPAQPPLALVAHMDHPGFEVVEAGGDGIVARALGGVPEASLAHDTAALALTRDGRVSVTLRPLRQPDDADSPQSDRLVALSPRSPARIGLQTPVVFDLPDFELDGDVIRMRALDDLAGCASILAALERTAAGRVAGDVYGVFTRAEEEGLLGARLMAEAGTLPHDTIVVSVESSAVIPGVRQGDGPVVRTGDAAYTFDCDAEQVLIAAREALRRRDRDFACQRQLMSGGVCEATAFAVLGYSVTGMAFPLGNYHNATTNIRDPDGGVGAEYIRLSDFLGGVALLTEAVKCFPKRGETPTRRRMGRVSDDVRRRLEETSNPI